MIIMSYRKRIGFLAPLTVAQISESSLTIGALGLNLSHLTTRNRWASHAGRPNHN